MLDPLKSIYATAKKVRRHIVLSEGYDPRIIDGAAEAIKQNLAAITLLGNKVEVANAIQSRGYTPSDFNLIDPADTQHHEAYASGYYELRKENGVTKEFAHESMRKPLNFAAMMVRLGDADGTVSGAVTTTANTVRAAIQIIKKSPDAALVSSFFLMVMNEQYHTKKGVFVFADCGLTIEPDAVQLSEIAIASARSYKSLTGREPKIGMLSFSTLGSARHEKVSKVQKATKLIREKEPDLTVSGELQFDAAFVPSVAQIKAPDDTVQGDANIFVFPNLNAGNIGYKIAQRIGGAQAIGPILQGLKKPANDLSRGCSAQDVTDMIAITAAQVK
ncbi:phosphate acetyltransferase [Ahrensia kielensis]|uniref:phosphate acetyltransferase n=1 Tax=Ahrensia kielensis TaxID=76980 RepID=UPI00036BEEF2|nr:phosphate acetyltransferase [Ahrensia kielensis]